MTFHIEHPGDCDKCKIPQLFQRYLDHDLTPEEAKCLQDYLEQYKPCSEHFDFDQKLRKMVKEKAAESCCQMDEATRRKIKDQLKKAR